MNIRGIFESLKYVPQDPMWHPEGDVWFHTAIVTYRIAANEHDPIEIAAAIFHDVGKLTTTAVDESGRITARKHEIESVRIFDEVAASCFPKFTTGMLEAVRFIIEHHMTIKNSVGRKRMQKMIDQARSIEKILDRSTDLLELLKRFAVADRMTTEDGTLVNEVRSLIDDRITVSYNFSFLIEMLHRNQRRYK